MATRSQVVAESRRVIRNLESVTVRTVSAAVSGLSGQSNQDIGGVYRTVASGTLATLGNVAAQSAIDEYEAFREIASPTAPRYRPTKAVISSEALIASSVGYGMSKVASGNLVLANAAFAVALGRQVLQYYRETSVHNTQEDSFATGYQRVASPTACAFCMTVALNQYTTFEESGGYHDDCNCSTVPIYNNQTAFRPSYYDEFEQDYNDFNEREVPEGYQFRELTSNNPGAETFQAIRATTNRR